MSNRKTSLSAQWPVSTDASIDCTCSRLIDKTTSMLDDGWNGVDSGLRDRKVKKTGIFALTRVCLLLSYGVVVRSIFL